MPVIRSDVHGHICRIKYPLPTPIVAIDPGASGGLVYFSPGVGTTAHRMPKTAQGIWDLVGKMCTGILPTSVYMERVWGYVGGAGNPGSHMFSFGQNYGHLQMAVVAACGKLPVEIRPQEWQTGLDIPVRKSFKEGRKKVYLETKPQFKARLKTLAQYYFPDVKVTLSICDALLITEYAKRKESADAGKRKDLDVSADGLQLEKPTTRKRRNS